MCVCVLHNSKTIKPSSLKLCMRTKKTPRKCKSENWVFGFIITPLLKIIKGLIIPRHEVEGGYRFRCRPSVHHSVIPSVCPEIVSGA